MTADLFDPTSKAYKRARKQHKKTTKNRPDSLDADWTPFRAAEKRYKAKFPPPDLSSVLDLALEDDSRAEEIEHGRWRGRADAVRVEEVQLGGSDDKRVRKRRAYIFPQIPGLVFLPQFLSEDTQRELIRWSLCDQARYPNETNLDTHYKLPRDGLWNIYIRSLSTGTDDILEPRASIPANPALLSHGPSGPRALVSNTPASPSTLPSIADTPKLPAAPSLTASPLSVSALIRKLRWANIGWFYHWGTKQYDFAKGNQPISPSVEQVCREAVRCVPWDVVYAGQNDEGWGDEGPDWRSWDETYEPDAGIVNFYQTKDTLMAHVDRSEVCETSPLVSISLGNAAVFLIGGKTRDVEPVPILLRSGDVVIMSGPACRRAYHGVPRILEDTLPAHFEPRDNDGDWNPYAQYLRTARINVNVRQVFPKGFDPCMTRK